MRIRPDARSLIFLLVLLGTGGARLSGQASQAASGAPAVSPANDSYDALSVADDLSALDGPELPQRGFNAAAAFGGVYDSQLGWAGFTQPAISYRFNRIFSTDATIPIYFYREGLKSSLRTLPNEHLTTLYGELGDTTIAGHAQFAPGWLAYTATTALNAPTGDAEYGLSTGQVTYEITNDFEASVKNFTPDLQLGFGDSSDLVNRQVQRNYDTLGLLAYFQLGTVYTLPRSWIVRGDAYEQLPIGTQKIFTNVIRRKKRVLILTNSSAEDNGLTVYLSSPATSHFQISSYYNDSLRLGDDTVGLTITLQLKTFQMHILPDIP
ncbi:MAG: hypothetical protein ACYDC6_08655 [Acidobacteriaceae bacterium]